MNKCIDCDKKISWGSKRCPKCYGLSRRGIERPEHSKKMTGPGNPMFGTHRIGLNKGNKHPHLALYNKSHSKGKENGMYGKQHTEKTKEKIKSKAKQRWKNKEYREKSMRAIFKASKIKPNKPEKQLSKLLNKILPNKYKYVGNWKVIIDGFNPDFINCNGKKKLIELFGDYWHSRKETKQRDKRRLKSYKKDGYKTLIIWQHELKNVGRLAKKILKFN